jgi:radical SAM protein with 4Fe4S-binding SPASM domain
MIDYYLRGTFCGCYADRLSISADGSVKPCPASSYDEVIGNVSNQPLSDIWIKFQHVRTLKYTIPIECTQCNKQQICRGGCRAYTFQKNGDYNHKDPLCNRTIIPTIGHCGHLMNK